MKKKRHPQTDEILRLLGRDHAATEISQMLGVGTATINAIAQRNGLKSSGKQGRKRQKALWGPEEPIMQQRAEAKARREIT